MNIIINGVEKQFEKNDSIDKILKILCINSEIMAVSINMNIIKKDMWQTYKLKSGDKIEFLEFVGGG
ncbi:MAG: thiamine biosynthesis protein ThiS [Epsilonproteobacteria bacterium]|nr:MAG: thiamine biosynthesis protein ThiS [Campylobacterota bacterium]